MSGQTQQFLDRHEYRIFWGWVEFCFFQCLDRLCGVVLARQGESLASGLERNKEFEMVAQFGLRLWNLVIRKGTGSYMLAQPFENGIEDASVCLALSLKI